MNSIIGKQAPDFNANAVINGEIKQNFKLSDLKGKYVLLYFYPLDFTFVCPTEIHAFQEKLNDFREKNVEVVGVSVDSHFSHLGLFLIDKEGIVRHLVVNDLSLGRNVDEALRMVDALQYTEKHGEVCPANWTKGEKSMKPTQEGLNEYFK